MDLLLLIYFPNVLHPFFSRNKDVNFKATTLPANKSRMRMKSHPQRKHPKEYGTQMIFRHSECDRVLRSMLSFRFMEEQKTYLGLAG